MSSSSDYHSTKSKQNDCLSSEVAITQEKASIPQIHATTSLQIRRENLPVRVRLRCDRGWRARTRSRTAGDNDENMSRAHMAHTTESRVRLQCAIDKEKHEQEQKRCDLKNNEANQYRNESQSNMEELTHHCEVGDEFKDEVDCIVADHVQVPQL